MKRAYYAEAIETFLNASPDAILGELVRGSNADGATLERSQSEAWLEQIRILKSALASHRNQGKVYFEYSIPRLGKRIDVVAVICSVIFVIEFKIGDKSFSTYAIDQV